MNEPLQQRLMQYSDALLLLKEVDIPVAVLDAGPDMMQVLSPLRLRVKGIVSLGFVYAPTKEGRVIVTAKVMNSETNKGQTGVALKLMKAVTRGGPKVLKEFLTRVLSYPNVESARFEQEKGAIAYYPPEEVRSVRALKENTIEIVGPNVPRHAPLAVRVPVEFQVGGAGASHAGTAYNVSPLAVSILSDSCVPQVDDEACVVFPYQRSNKAVSIVLRGRVSWVIPRTPQHATGFGVQLGKLSKSDAKNWILYIKQESVVS